MPASMRPPVRALRDLHVSAQGLGCLPTTDFYGRAEPDRSLATIRAALDAGVTLLDTADVQGLGAGEKLLGQAVAGRRDEVVIATKFGMVRSADGGFQGLCGKPSYVRGACERSLLRLGVDHIDLYYQHWIDPAVPVEETAGAVAELVREGKVRYFGLSEPSAGTLRRADAVHPVTAVQSEWSLWSRDIEAEVAPASRALGIGIVAYAPLGRGFLTGGIHTIDDLAAEDFRRSQPRFSAVGLAHNQSLLDRLRPVADGLGLTLAQLALAWLHHRGPDVVPIPGTSDPGHLTENLAAASVQLDQAARAAVAEAIAVPVHGERYAPAMLAMTGN
ncbi:aldo/keto reductase [Streptomyces sp. NA02950]|uniref:aldo/keto reductase n=1 Tax=Streptomyces sp. NA02950 TaxID=2742137 RepID=UPI0015912691|nr:aldo/keto reductase [Streptomyces sp. NA02950]QKV97090.1 aldo/keto reductase [Streptomyces sp. NA02950]